MPSKRRSRCDMWSEVVTSVTGSKFRGRFEAVFLTTDARISAITEMGIQIYPDGAQMGVLQPVTF